MMPEAGSDLLAFVLSQVSKLRPGHPISCDGSRRRGQLERTSPSRT